MVDFSRIHFTLSDPSAASLAGITFFLQVGILTTGMGLIYWLLIKESLEQIQAHMVSLLSWMGA